MSIRKGNLIISGKGANGADGYSPTATVTKVGDTATISITDKNGTTTATVSDGDTPEIITNIDSTYTISNLSGNKSYKLGELLSLTISYAETFDRESIIYFESGTTPTDISIPDTLTNLGDVPTFTTSGGVSTGTCNASKSYIISILNNITIWKEY